MSHFFSEIIADKSKTTRTGSQKTGLKASVSGWRLGAEIRMRFDEVSGQDLVELFLTGGSGSPATKKIIGVWNESWDKIR